LRRCGAPERVLTASPALAAPIESIEAGAAVASIDSADTAIAQGALGKKLGQLSYNPDADWDRDGVVGTRDVAQFGPAPRTAAGRAALPSSAFQDRDFLSHTP
jgi:hypothetical protein